MTCARDVNREADSEFGKAMIVFEFLVDESWLWTYVSQFIKISNKVIFWIHPLLCQHLGNPGKK